MAPYRTLSIPAAAAVELLAFWKRNAEQFTILSLTCSQDPHFCQLSALRAGFFLGLTVTEMRAPVIAEAMELVLSGA